MLYAISEYVASVFLISKKVDVSHRWWKLTVRLLSFLLSMPYTAPVHPKTPVNEGVGYFSTA